MKDNNINIEVAYDKLGNRFHLSWYHDELFNS